MTVDLTAEPVGCPQCGCAIIDWPLHQRWHENSVRAVDLLAQATTATAATLAHVADQLGDR